VSKAIVIVLVNNN